MNPNTDQCNIVQRSLEWCEGKPVLPGIRRRLYYIAKKDIVLWPGNELQTLSDGAAGNRAMLAGSFELKADAYWKAIDILVDKSTLTSEPQGEYPSQTQLNKLTAVHPGVGEEATEAALYFNNVDCVFLVPTMDGKWRLLGNKLYQGKVTLSQDQGQGATGSAATTINAEHTDQTPCPFYNGSIVTGYVTSEENGETVSVAIEGNENNEGLRDG